MRAILIDPVTKTVTETAYNDDYRQIYKLLSDEANGLKVDCFTVVYIDRRNAIFIDDEGLLKNPRYFFFYRGYPQPLAGRGLILGCDRSGENVATSLIATEVAREITFRHLSVQGWQQFTGKTDASHPLGPDAHVIKIEPVFGPPERE